MVGPQPENRPAVTPGTDPRPRDVAPFASASQETAWTISQQLNSIPTSSTVADTTADHPLDLESDKLKSNLSDEMKGVASRKKKEAPVKDEGKKKAAKEDSEENKKMPAGPGGDEKKSSKETSKPPARLKRPQDKNSSDEDDEPPALKKRKPDHATWYKYCLLYTSDAADD